MYEINIYLNININNLPKETKEYHLQQIGNQQNHLIIDTIELHTLNQHEWQ